MLIGGYKQADPKLSPVRPREKPSCAWKEQAYVVPSPSRRSFQWKALALRSVQRFSKAAVTGHPVTVVVPALYNLMPAEAVALGWLNEIDALGAIRHRILDSTKLTGWDVFTFHTRHNLDPFYASTIAAVRETWLREGALKSGSIAETVKRYGPAYQYNCISPRLIENLVIQTSLMEWLGGRAKGVPLRFHVIGTGLMSALVWAGAMTFEDAVHTASKIGARWDASLTSLVEEELERSGAARTEENVGWARFNRVRQIVEGRSMVSLGTSGIDRPPGERSERKPDRAQPTGDERSECKPGRNIERRAQPSGVEAPLRPFWFSVTAKDEPVRIETVRDVRDALKSMDIASWSPNLPKCLPSDCADRVRGWLVSPLHPMASVCRRSVYNYLLATPSSGLLFLEHIAALGRLPLPAPRPKVSGTPAVVAD